MTKAAAFLIVLLSSLAMAITPTQSLMPYTRSSLWDMMLPPEDPFRILEQSPLTIPAKGVEAMGIALALARADWKETVNSHVISLDIPGMKKEDVKIEVEENRVLRISGERKGGEEVEGEKWHRVERAAGKFWRQFRMPGNADLEKVNAKMENGVLTITVPKVAEKKKQAKVIDIAEEKKGVSAQNIEATKAAA
ncbi:unnamed protein product [Linum tenue]|uniref:SHSP domain-containing protein n=1 Tax=Linum tenue TaxID=586396 RepID=A0AAV0GUY6_9ROSI|nr:unnamed protein product [Linum tenue]